MEKHYKWTKASEKLPPINEKVIIKDGEQIYTDSTNLGWDRQITDYEWLEEAKNISSSLLLSDSLLAFNNELSRYAERLPDSVKIMWNEIMANNVLCDVDYSQMSDNDLLKIGFKLMSASVKNLLNNDAKEHQEYERYMIELESRQINIT